MKCINWYKIKLTILSYNDICLQSCWKNESDMWFPYMVYERHIVDVLVKGKKPHKQGLVGLKSKPTKMPHMCEGKLLGIHVWSLTLNKNDKSS